MSSSQYRGDSLQKNRVRLTAYGGLSKKDFFDKKHVVVAGTGGDIKALTELGVTPENIIACDKSVGYRANASRLGATVPEGIIGTDIALTTRWAVETFGRKNLGSVNVDLCMSLINGVPILDRTIESVPEGIPVFFTFACYRDPGLSKEEGEEIPGKKRIDYFQRTVGESFDKVEFHPYKSWTRTSLGTPMCMAICH